MPRIRPSGETFKTRLDNILLRGNLRVSDLARWFDRPHPTVNGWVKRGLNPSGGPADVDHAYSMMGLLEALLKVKHCGLPVPQGMSPKHRKMYVMKIRNIALNPKVKR